MAGSQNGEQAEPRIGGVGVGTWIAIAAFSISIATGWSYANSLQTQIDTLTDKLGTFEPSQGPKGDKGDKGEQGLKGERGPIGKEGVKRTALNSTKSISFVDECKKLLTISRSEGTTLHVAALYKEGTVGRETVNGQVLYGYLETRNNNGYTVRPKVSCGRNEFSNVTFIDVVEQP